MIISDFMKNRVKKFSKTFLNFWLFMEIVNDPLQERVHPLAMDGGIQYVPFTSLQYIQFIRVD